MAVGRGVRATLSFDLPDDREEFHDACNGQVYACALRDIADAFRNARKHDAEPVDEDKFWEILRERGIELE